MRRVWVNHIQMGNRSDLILGREYGVPCRAMLLILLYTDLLVELEMGQANYITEPSMKNKWALISTQILSKIFLALLFV